VERAALRRLAVEVPPLADAEVERVEELAGLRRCGSNAAGAQ
jgi:hypothetical protein